MRGGGCASHTLSSMPTVLDDIIAGVREDLAQRQVQISLDEISRAAAAAPPARPVIEALRRPTLSHCRGQAAEPQQG